MVDGWKRGRPPAGHYPGIAYDYDVYFSPAGFVWHRLITPEEKEKINRLFRSIDEAERSKPHVK